MKFVSTPCNTMNLPHKDRELIDKAKRSHLTQLCALLQILSRCRCPAEERGDCDGHESRKTLPTHPEHVPNVPHCFYANSQYPDQPVQTLAIAARSESGYLDTPIPPCGACRQVLLETEQRYQQPMRILLYGENAIYEIDGNQRLVTLIFRRGVF